MAEIWANTVGKLESMLPMEGPMAVPGRAAIGAAAGYLLMEAIRPEFAYTPEGKPRPDAVFPDLFPGEGKPTFTPRWIGPVAGAVILTTFI